MKKYFASIGKDLPSSIIVFLVALPLSLGVVQASNPVGLNIIPLVGGIIASIVGGIIIGFFSGSQLSVSGPTAGLTSVVAASLVTLSGTNNPYDTFLLAVFIAGILQIIMGFAKLGIIGDYIPNSVIKGMLAAIGLILILKQFPHLIGEDSDPEGDESFNQPNNKNTFTALYYAAKHFTPTAAIVGAIGLGIIILWETKFFKKHKLFQLIPGALVVVIVGTLINEALKLNNPTLALNDKHLVILPASQQELWASFRMPDFNQLLNYKVYTIALTIALVASLETLLGIEAVDKLDPLKRVTSSDRELKAQGIGNMVSGLLGGLPLTSVVVRSSANVTAGAQTKVSTILHGFFLLISVLVFPFILNKIPLAALAAVLIYTGYKLAKISIFKELYKKGWDQFIPFTVTIIAILATDLLKGIVVGILVALFFLVRSNFKSNVLVVHENNNYLLRMRKDVSFLNKPIIIRLLEKVPPNSYLLIDSTRADFIDQDIIEAIKDFLCHAHIKNIQVEIKTNHHNKMNQFT
jgi:MFS superfamily sulfate permease-like transporter